MSPSDLGLLVLRVFAGLVIAAHGAQKVFGVWGGAGLRGEIGIMSKMNLWPSWFWGTVASLAEFVGGILLALGFLSPLGPLALFATMLMAVVKAHWSRGFWSTKGGFEYPLTLMVIGLTLGLAGPGPYSLDAMIHWAPPEPTVFVAGLILAVAGVVVGLNSGTLGKLIGQSASH